MIQLPDNVSKSRALIRKGEIAISLIRRGYGRALSLGNEDEILFASGALFGGAWNEMAQNEIVARTEWKMARERLTALERHALEDREIPTFVLWHDLRVVDAQLALVAVEIQPVSSPAVSDWGVERFDTNEAGYVRFLYDIRYLPVPDRILQFIQNHSVEARIRAACEREEEASWLIRRLKQA